MIATWPALRWRSMERRRPQPDPVPCAGLTASHTGVDPQRFVIGPNRLPIIACVACAAVIGSLTTIAPDRRRP